MSSGGGSGYDYSLTTFSRSGKLNQIEYALNAVEKGALCVGVKGSNGSVLVCDRKRASKLIETASIERMSMVCENIGVVYAGMGPDARILVSRARRIAQAHFRTYGTNPSVAYLVREIASVMQEYTQSGGVRTFGVSLLVIGCDDTGPSLYQVDPSGAGWAWRAAAIGKQQAMAKSFLEKRYAQDIDVEDAVHLALLALKENFEGVMDADSVEISLAKDGLFRTLSTSEAADYLANL